MPRKTTTFIADTTGPQRIALNDIPDEVKAFVEDTYKQQRTGNGRTRVEYDTADELALEFKQMADYCAQRKAGVLRIRKSPTRNLPDTVMEFRITADVEANGNRNAGNDRRQTPAAAGR